MRLSPSLLALCSLAIGAVATTSSTEDYSTTTYTTTYCPTPSEGSCASRSAAVQLLRLYNPSTVDHFYTVSTAEADNAVNNLGYLREQNAGLVFPTPTTGTVPFYRLYNTTISDNFYTISLAGVDYTIQVAGYTFNGIAGYVYSGPQCGAVPFYRMYDPVRTDHFYTTSVSERDSAISGGYTDEGIDGYILPE